jgi:hypothetical protein
MRVHLVRRSQRGFARANAMLAFYIVKQRADFITVRFVMQGHMLSTVPLLNDSPRGIPHIGVVVLDKAGSYCGKQLMVEMKQTFRDSFAHLPFAMTCQTTQAFGEAIQVFMR